MTIKIRKKIAILSALCAGLFALGTASAQQPPGQEEQQQQQQQQEQKEIKGRLLGMFQNTLYIASEDGAVIAVRVNRQSMLDGERLQGDQRIGAQLQQKFQQGQEVHAVVTIRRDQRGELRNVAVKITKEGEGQQKQQGQQ